MPFDLTNIQIDPSSGKPRVLVLGDKQHHEVMRQLFGAYRPRRHAELDTNGFGFDPQMYDHWVPANQAGGSFAADVLVTDAQGHPYPFDLIVLDLTNWRDCYLKKSAFHPDPYNLLVWSLERLVTGGVLILVGDDFLFTQLVGPVCYRMTSVHGQRSGSMVVLVGCKKEQAAPDYQLKKEIAAFFSSLKESDFGPAFCGVCAYQFLTRRPVYRVSRHRPDGPHLLSRVFNRDYIARAMVESNLAGPFERIRGHYAARSGERNIRIPMPVPIGHLAKLATVAKGVVQDDRGHLWVMRGTAETVHVEKAGVARDLKRITMLAVQVKGDDPGHLLETQIG